MENFSEKSIVFNIISLRQKIIGLSKVRKKCNNDIKYFEGVFVKFTWVKYLVTKGR